MNYGITSTRFFTGLILALALFPMISCEKESFIPALTPEPVEPQNLAEASAHAQGKSAYAGFRFRFRYTGKLLYPGWRPPECSHRPAGKLQL